MDYFALEYDNGKLYAVVIVNGVTYRKDVTYYFDQDNPHDDWLDYRLGLKLEN